MHKKIFLFFFLLPGYLLTAQAQPVCTGKMLDAKEGKIEPICYLRTLNPIGNITKYIIVLAGVEMYEIQFEYDKEGDSITIKFYDKGNTTVKKEIIRLKSEDSHFLICEFKPNIKPILNSDTYRILFGIDHPDQQFITLYQFQAIGGTQTQFQLQDVPADIMALHLEAVNDKETIDNIRLRHTASVASLKRDMVKWKDSLINTIKESEASRSSREAYLLALPEMQTAFSKQMDNVFLNYFKNVHPFTDEMYDVNFRFVCDASGAISVDTEKSMVFKNGPQKNWFRDSFLLHIKPRIERGNYNTLSETNSYPEMKASFDTWVESRYGFYPNLGISDRDSFNVLQTDIINELETYKSRTISIACLYNYSFTYKSSIKTPLWRYAREKDGDKFIDKSEPLDKIEITEDLKQIFRNKYGASPNGKYLLQVSIVEMKNGAVVTQDIKLINKI